jgi:hypothetical protein
MVNEMLSNGRLSQSTVWHLVKLRIPTTSVQYTSRKPVPKCSKISLYPGCPRKLFADNSKKPKRKKTGHLRETAGRNKSILLLKSFFKLVKKAFITTTQDIKFPATYKNMHKKYSISDTDVKNILLKKLWY